MTTNILVTGMYWSGSSALIDLLKEFSSVSFVSPPNEFDDFRRFGLIGDILEQKISDDYPNKLTELANSRVHSNLSFKGLILNIYDTLKINAFIRNKNIGKSLKYRKRYQSLQKLADFLESDAHILEKINKTSQWIIYLSEIYGEGNEFLLFDQPIFHGHHMDIWPQIFSPFKMIIVFRDPRDQLAQIVQSGNLYFDMSCNLTYNIPEIYGYERINMLKYQCDAIESRFNKLEKIKSHLRKDELLLISFEDLILNYNVSRNIIIKFLGLKAEDHVNQFKYLKPQKSKNNIGIYYKHLQNNELHLANDLMPMYYKLKNDLHNKPNEN